MLSRHTVRHFAWLQHHLASRWPPRRQLPSARKNHCTLPGAERTLFDLRQRLHRISPRDPPKPCRQLRAFVPADVRRHRSCRPSVACQKLLRRLRALLRTALVSCWQGDWSSTHRSNKPLGAASVLFSIPSMSVSLVLPLCAWGACSSNCAAGPANCVPLVRDHPNPYALRAVSYNAAPVPLDWARPVCSFSTFKVSTATAVSINCDGACVRLCGSIPTNSQRMSAMFATSRDKEPLRERVLLLLSK